MKSREFCYWLQGLFELEESLQLNANQTQVVKQHLKLVFDYGQDPNSFCHALNGFFQINNPVALTPMETNNIRQLLRQTFAREIDPTYPKQELSLLYQAHYPQHEASSRVIAKC